MRLFLIERSNRRSIIFFGILFALCCFSCVQPVVILVHGSLAQQENWFRPQGLFYQALQRAAALRGHCTVPFSWTGYLTSKEIVKAGELLGCLLVSYPNTEEIIIVGHSNGGNVAFAASQWLSRVRHHDVCFDHTKQLSATGRLSTIFDSLYKVLRKSSSVLCSYVIHQLFLLGTPINDELFVPDMSNIAALFNLYSEGDALQLLVGKRELPMQQRVINIAVTLDTGNTLKAQLAPSHSDLHHSLIGKSLLDIPDLLMQSFGHGDLEKKRWSVHISKNLPYFISR